jgi:hypothetical protein
MVVCASVVVVSAISAFGGGCAPVDDADRFREPLPVQDEVSLGVPSHGASSSTKTQGLTIQTTNDLGGATTNAQYYALTRAITGGVDGVTGVILGGIWAIVHTTPTSLSAKSAVWGPGSSNALEPAIWRFTVNEVGDAEYDYVLEGQPKSGGAWMSVLTGHGYGKSRPEHGQGWFQADNDAYKKLEPDLGHDQGTTKVTYDLRQIPVTLAVELRPGGNLGSLDILVTHEAGGAGEVSIKGSTDLDASKATKLEDIDLASRWMTDGSGRADLTAKDGDLPFTVTATECWSTTFQRVFYKDSVNFEPASGDPKSCTLAAPTP